MGRLPLLETTSVGKRPRQNVGLVTVTVEEGKRFEEGRGRGPQGRQSITPRGTLRSLVIPVSPGEDPTSLRLGLGLPQDEYPGGYDVH